jgi:hypothetical protein
MAEDTPPANQLVFWAFAHRWILGLRSSEEREVFA